MLLVLLVEEEEGEEEGGMVAEEGGRGGRAETCNHPNNRFYPFHPLWICVAR